MMMMLSRSLIRRSTRSCVSYFATDASVSAKTEKVWEKRMCDEEFASLRSILSAPSPVGLETALLSRVQDFLSHGRGIPSSWKFHSFIGNAGLVLDTDPNKSEVKPTIMFMGHADKIRMQVRKITEDGKVYIDSDSHLPATLLGNEVVIYTHNPTSNEYSCIHGGTIEALGAIHFADAEVRSGKKGITAEQLYVELQLHGEKRKEYVAEELGIRVGDCILMDRPIRRGVGVNSFQGAYLDNGLGCFVTAKAAKLVAEALEKNPSLLENVRVLFAFATHEEIGRFGSRVLVNQFKPHALVAVDVNHDYNAAPGVAAKNFPDIGMGKGPTLSVGSVVTPWLNNVIQRSANRAGIPLQLDVVGRDTGTDAMAAVLSSIDCACTSLGVPVRNMHTISETACTNDVLAAAHLVLETVEQIATTSGALDKLVQHPDLSKAKPFTVRSET